MKKILDLCSGLGGASQAFVNSNDWEVLRIENNPLLAHVAATTNMCIFDFEDWIDTLIETGVELPTIEFLWASPPCTEFSMAYNAPRSNYERENPGERFKPDMDMLHCIISIITKLKPKYWCIENVKGSPEFFNPIIGQEPRQIIQAYFLWGNFPFIQTEKLPSKMEKDVSSANPLRANYRGLVPLVISEALLAAIEEQRSILEY